MAPAKQRVFRSRDSSAIHSTLVICNNETKYVADLQVELGAVPPVLCHPGELSQAILNLVVNAAHAIADAPKQAERKGTIGIRTWTEPGWVRISISDTGTGIPTAILDKIYEPFFTTKEVGKGSGQGLAIVRAAIVEKHAARSTSRPRRASARRSRWACRSLRDDHQGSWCECARMGR